LLVTTRRNTRHGFPRRIGLVVPFLSLAASLLLSYPAAFAQSVDVTNLRRPIDIGTQGLVLTGDNPAYAQPDFDDSKWLPVDTKTRLSEYFPHNHSPIIWRRIHVKVDAAVDAGPTQLAIQALNVSRAFEVYVNGQKLIQSGQVDPFVPYTRSARLIAPIPKSQLRTGSLVIAVRARAPQTWWGSTGPAFNGPMLTLGDQTALNSQNTLSMISENAATFLENLFAFGVGLVALALFINQRHRREYLWIFILGALNVASLPLIFLSIVRNIPVTLWNVNEFLFFATLMSMLFTIQAFLPKPFGKLVWLFMAGACFIAIVCDVIFLDGFLPGFYDAFFTLAVAIVFSGLVPFLLYRQWKRGDREAGLLLIPILLYSLWNYEQIVTRLLQIIPPLSAFALRISHLANELPAGVFTVGLADLGILSFYFSLVLIIVLRSTRMSHQQAMLEGEMAAAREVQQLIVPEKFESVPGFTVESVYQPSQQVGGDFFQILPANDGGLLIVVGDVAGKGLPAAMLVSVLVGAIRTAAEDTHNPALILCKLNNRLLGRTGGGFSTAIAAHISSDGWVSVSSAGHLSPYLDGREIELDGALPLGITSDCMYEATQLYLAPSSRLTFYSDGIVEAQNPAGQLFGFERARSMSILPASIIAEAARQFGQSDDITVVTVQRAAAVASAA